jgi:hypothetical protein
METAPAPVEGPKPVAFQTVNVPAEIVVVPV